ncbi:DUF3122 domain-containing protein [Nostoc sphaeroides]|uniref:Uncharacterized protein n=1 Tax=Nostoc sphaeroides CCNUC1 TaxID=2653204 RepID=A0A5P8W8Q2_9NOSO|nr:DUF3122 domain-containing protein [Nostoc sphaeroides]MCC5627295.1 DUF3122 domain-containing protein [Nostoc sphaeroides CHAB 2801]QFS49135.1 hypothetical protein GXM_06629 [Nostoc sphaeroides CCNUC1]
MYYYNITKLRAECAVKAFNIKNPAIACASPVKDLRLRLVAFPGVVEIAHPQPLLIEKFIIDN